MERKIVQKIEEGVDPSQVYCTTYQMRNFYAQFADGFFSSLDVMNYIQHHAAVRKMKAGWRVLDVCCGRGLLLPLMRYYSPKVAEYIGVDIWPANIGAQRRVSGIKKIEDMDAYYPFKVTHIIDSVEDMHKHLEKNSIDMVVYTSAIEHMQKDVGFKSLRNCHRLLKPGRQMFLSCPNTHGKTDPYDTQYAAHVYEWGLDELREAVNSIGFEIVQEVGLVAKVREFEQALQDRNTSDARMEMYARLKKYLPSQWLMAIMPLLYGPEMAAEVLLVCEKKDPRRLV